MDYDVRVKEIEARPTVVIRTETAPKSLGETFAELLPEVSAYLDAKGVQSAGPAFGRFFDYTKDRVDMEAGFPVASPGEGEGRVEPSELPGGRVGVALHVGPYTALPHAYEAMTAWMK